MIIINNIFDISKINNCELKEYIKSEVMSLYRNSPAKSLEEFNLRNFIGTIVILDSVEDYECTNNNFLILVEDKELNSNPFWIENLKFNSESYYKLLFVIDFMSIIEIYIPNSILNPQLDFILNNVY